MKLKNIAKDMPDEGNAGFVVTDRRPSYAGYRDPKSVDNPCADLPEVEYTPFRPIFDRLLVKRVGIGKDQELFEDGSIRNIKSGLVIPSANRQHSNIGIVLAAGDFVIMGGVKIPLKDVVYPGCRVTFGDYNSELFNQDEEITKGMCERVGTPYFYDDGGLRIIRVQDIRGVEYPAGAVVRNG